MASADSVLRVNARSAEVNSRRAKIDSVTPRPAPAEPHFYPGKYIQKQ